MDTDYDVSSQYYESMRLELIAHIKLSNNAIFIFLTMVAALYGAAFGVAGGVKEVLLIVPFLSLGATFIVCQHDALSGAIASYLKHELNPHLSGEIPQWDDSKALKIHSKKLLFYRHVSFLVLLLIPPVGALSINHGHLLGEFPFGYLSLFGLFATLATAALIFENWMYRRSIR